MATKRTYNIFSNQKGAAGTFKVEGKESVYSVVLNFTDGPVVSIVDFSVPGKYKCILPTRFDAAKVDLVVEVLQNVMKDNSYPSIEYVRGIIYPEQVDVNYVKDYPLGEFIPRVMQPGRKDHSEKQYRQLAAAYYPLDSSIAVSKERFFENSLDYAPFAELVEGYDMRKEKYYSLKPVEKRIMEGIKSGNVSFVGLYGAPGTGKSTAMQIIAIKLGLPYRQCVGRFEDNDQLVGCYAPELSEDKEKVLPKFQYGALLECYEYGGLFIMDEANYTDQRIMATFQGMLDGSSSYFEKTTKRLINKHPNFVVAFTWNPKAKGSLPFNEALMNRMEMSVPYKKLTTGELLLMLMTQYPDADPDFMGKLCECPGMIEAWATQVNSTGYCSIRQLESFYNSISTESLSLENFKSEFVSRILYPVVFCNSFNVDKVDAIVSSAEFNTFIDELFSLYGGGNMTPVDYEFYLGCRTTSSSTEGSSDDADEIESMLSSFAAKI